MKANKKNFIPHFLIFFQRENPRLFASRQWRRVKGETFNTPIKRTDKQSNRRQTRGVARKKTSMARKRKRETKISANTERKRSSQLTCVCSISHSIIRYAYIFCISNLLPKLDLLFRPYRLTDERDFDQTCFDESISR